MDGEPLVEDRLDQAASAVAMDGKTLCGTLGEHGRSLQLLSLFDQKTGCVLSQLEVPQDTNEAKAASRSFAHWSSQDA